MQAGKQTTCWLSLTELYHQQQLPVGARQKAEPGALDDILPEVLPILEGELWGDVADEKEAGAFAGSCREAKKLRAADTFQLLAQGTTFRTCIGPLLRPVRPPFSLVLEVNTQIRWTAWYIAEPQGTCASAMPLLFATHGKYHHLTCRSRVHRLPRRDT